VLSDALRQRPDLLAGVAKLRATDAEIAAARSALFPKVSLSGNVQGNIGQLNVNNSPYFPVAKPQGAALLKFEWPLYEGGLLQNKLSLAQSGATCAAASCLRRPELRAGVPLRSRPRKNPPLSPAARPKRCGEGAPGLARSADWRRSAAPQVRGQIG